MAKEYKVINMKFKVKPEKNCEIFENAMNDMAKQGWTYRDQISNGIYLVFERDV